MRKLVAGRRGAGLVVAVTIASCWCLAFSAVAAGLPPLGPDVPNSAAKVEPLILYKWVPNQAVAYNFTIDSKVAREALKTSGQTTYRGGGEYRGTRDEAASNDGSGTGFVIHPEGIVVTCAHVVKGASKIVTRIAGREYEATVIGLDLDNDLAILRLPVRDLAFLSLMNSDQVRLAQEVRAVGYPLSDVLGESIKVTRGEISGIGNAAGDKILQIDVTTNPGNSGGPVLNSSGRVAGVASQMLVGAGIAEVGFAVPSNEVIALAKRLRVPVSVLDSAPQVPAPEMIAAATPSIVLLKVKYGAAGFGLDEQQVVTFSGFFWSYAPPGGSIGQSTNDSGKLVVDRLGQITTFDGKEDLPFLLGSVGSVGIETLPVSAKDKSTTSRPIFLQCAQEQRAASGTPYSLRPRPRLGAPWSREPERTKIALQEGIEKVVYELGGQTGALIELKKKHEVVIAGTTKDAPPFLTLVGQGTAQFNRERGFVQSMAYESTVTINEDNVAVRIPVRFNYSMKDAAELERDMAESAARRKAAAKAREQIQASPPTSNPSPASPPFARPSQSSSPIANQTKYPSVRDLAPSPQLDQFTP